MPLGDWLIMTSGKGYSPSILEFYELSFLGSGPVEDEYLWENLVLLSPPPPLHLGSIQSRWAILHENLNTSKH